jgi:hypothetical protein
MILSFTPGCTGDYSYIATTRLKNIFTCIILQTCRRYAAIIFEYLHYYKKYIILKLLACAQLIFLYYYFLSQGFNQEVLKSIKGAQLPRVGYEDFYKINVPFPPKEKQQQIVEHLDQVQNIVKSNMQLINIYEQKIKDRIAKVWGE